MSTRFSTHFRSRANGATPSGLVTVSDNAANSCSATIDGTGSGNCPLLETVADGPFIVSGSYAGDSNYNPTTASPTPSVTVTDNAASVETGGSVVFTATVAGAGPVVTPAGTVSWALSGETSLGTPTCADSSLADGTATCTISGVDATTYTATVTYGGDANYAAGASGSDDTADVGPAPLTSPPRADRSPTAARRRPSQPATRASRTAIRSTTFPPPPPARRRPPARAPSPTPPMPRPARAQSTPTTRSATRRARSWSTPRPSRSRLPTSR